MPTGVYKRTHLPPAEVRLWNKLQLDEASGCWLFRGARVGGYGRIGKADGGTWGAHEMMATWFHGGRPDGHECCHTCDNRACCNPDHLYWGTRKQNVADMWARGRAFVPPGRRPKR